MPNKDQKLNPNLLTKDQIIAREFKARRKARDRILNDICRRDRIDYTRRFVA